MSYLKKSEGSSYKIYFYCKPFLGILFDESIKDFSINGNSKMLMSLEEHLKESSNYNAEFHYYDPFFNLNFGEIVDNEFSIFIVVDGGVIHELSCEMDCDEIGNDEVHLKFLVNQIFVSNVGTQWKYTDFLPLKIISYEEEEYKAKRASYFRGKKIDALLDRDE